MANTYFLLAGEASGDLHGAGLIAALRRLEPSARFVGMGGPRMAAAGLEIAQDLSGMQVVGFWEVAKRYGFFKEVFYRLLDRLKQERPTALICIDYPGFNLRFAKQVHAMGIPCLYYIVPQVWAWKPRRAARMAEFIDRAFCVFEFEPPFFDRFRSPARKMKTIFVGHPLLDQPRPSQAKLPAGPKVVSFIPGSRENEFRKHLPVLESGERQAGARLGSLRSLWSFCMPPSPSDSSSVQSAGSGSIRFRDNQSTFWLTPGKNGKPDWRCEASGGRLLPSEPPFSLSNPPGCSHASLLPSLSDFSVVKSGTSTLEAGLQGNPMCVVYRGGWISYVLARMMVDIPVVSLVNIVLGRYAVQELIQGDMSAARIAAEIERGLTDPRYIEAQRAALAELPGRLGGPGATQRAAQGMLDFLQGRE